MASEGQRKSSIPESNWSAGDTTVEAMEVIQFSSSKAPGLPKERNSYGV
jgi:hypothetical protein